MARCSHCEDDRLARCSYADCPFEVEEAQRTNETFQTRITELEAEVERLTKELLRINAEFDELCREKLGIERVGSTEALSRTGAVKVLDPDMPAQEMRLHMGEMTAQEMRTARAAIQWANTRLPALEPAAPEGRQKAVAYRVHAPEDEHYGTGPDRLQFHPLAQRDLDNGYRQTPLYGRPSEQAVTEAKTIRPEIKSEMEILKRLAAGDQIAFSEDGECAFFTDGDRAFVGQVIISMRSKGYLKRVALNDENYRGTAERDVISDAGRSALKAAMEAGRHD